MNVRWEDQHGWGRDRGRVEFQRYDRKTERERERRRGREGGRERQFDILPLKISLDYLTWT